MKFNLKNRPEWIGQPRVHYREVIEHWFEGFEKELREIKESEHSIDINAWELIKEILGES